MLAANAAAALLVSVTFVGVWFDTPWREAVRGFGISFLFSNCIGIPVAAAMHFIGPFVWGRFRFPANWLIAIGLMMTLALAGSSLAIGLLIAFGVIPSGAFPEWFAGSFRISLITTVTVGIAVTIYELMRERLDETTLALRTKERDEAEARRLATQAQLASLESRVQPHFLFNTLNSIAALIPRDPEGAERMTGQLATLLRSSLDGAGSPLVPLAQELQIVRDYLEIERVRFGSRLRYDLSADGVPPQAMVPRLALQTLVENSVKYAVAPRRDGGTLGVRAGLRDSRLQVEVEDDGPGFNPSTAPADHGLALLRSRLAMLFGDEASLTIDSKPGRTVVGFEVPIDSEIADFRSQISD
jgi:sensor histidine kinase YesM